MSTSKAESGVDHERSTASTTDAPSGSVAPYYADAFVTLYHGDCRDILPTLGSVALVIADPPYRSLDIDVIRGTTTRLVGGGTAAGRRPSRANRIGSEGQWFATLSDDDLLSVLGSCVSALNADGALYVFADVKTGLAIYPRLSPANVLVWDKGRIGMGYSWRRMHEWIAYCPRPKHQLRSAAFGDIIRCSVPNEKIHATEKPISVLLPLIENSSDVGSSVLDPFAGSGSTLFAAKTLRRLAIGIEISERNCEIAANRCRQETFDLGGVA